MARSLCHSSESTDRAEIDALEHAQRAETEAQLAEHVARQLNNLVPDPRPVTPDDLRPALPEALARLEHCFGHVDNKYFFDGSSAVFSHLHGDQWAMWLYLLSNTLFRQGAGADLCSKLFLLVHPLGTVLGRGEYSDFFVSYQRVGVGSNHDVYPRFGSHVTLRPGASVLGKSSVGTHCQIAADTLVIDRDIADNTTIMGRPGSYRNRANPSPYPLWR